MTKNICNNTYLTMVLTYVGLEVEVLVVFKVVINCLKEGHLYNLGNHCCEAVTDSRL